MSMVEESKNLQQARTEDSATIAVVKGEAVRELPTDLYIPPEALEVFLETFEGPLDLLLYLIRRQNLDILNIQVAVITEQYMQYIEMMQALELELAGEYLVMAAMLAEIKSRMLLPRPENVEEEEGDPRAELIRRLQEYEQIKSAAEDLNEIPRLERDTYLAAASKPQIVRELAEPEVEMKDLLLALAQVLRRSEMYAKHEVQLETLSVRHRMGDILAMVTDAPEFLEFTTLFHHEEGRMGVVVTFLAIMELVREGMLEFVQAESFAPIHVRSAQGENAREPLFGSDFVTTYGGESDIEEATE